MKLEGLNEALDEIDAEVSKVKKKSQAGFVEVGLKVLRQSMRNLKASVVTGNLRASGYTRVPDGTVTRPDPEKLNAGQNESIPRDRIGDLGVEVGHSAVYALNVHENLQGSRTPKFLENVVTSNKREIVEIIKKRSGGQ